MAPIKRGTARHLGLRHPGAPVVLALITGAPGQPIHRLVAGGSRLRVFYANESGRCVPGPQGVTIGAGQIGWDRVAEQSL